MGCTFGWGHWAFLAALTGGTLAAQQLSTVPTGCFTYGYKFTPALANVTGQPFSLGSALECQARCRATPGCCHFGYWKKSRECWLGDFNSKLIRAMTEGAVSGPAFCPQAPPACTAIPGPSFPAQTDRETRAAWPGGEQPGNLQCWPRLPSGFPAPCQSRMATVLEDTATGWPGRCDGLNRVTDLLPGETCQMRCFQSALCGVWSEENVTLHGAVSCWHGLLGSNCHAGSGIAPLRAQRVMHGNFRVLMNTMGMQIMNLTKAFMATTIPNKTQGAISCRLTCLSYLFCQYWQYSTVWGCWIEDPLSSKVAYPLVNNGLDMMMGVDSANTVKAGEYIQHTCEPGPAMALPTDPPGTVLVPQKARSAMAGPQGQHMTLRGPQGPMLDAGPAAGPGGSAMPVWAVLLIALAVALCLVAVGIAAFVSMMDRDKHGTRGAKLSPGSGKGPKRGALSTATPSFASQSSSFNEAAPLMQAAAGQPQTQPMAHGFSRHGHMPWM